MLTLSTSNTLTNPLFCYSTDTLVVESNLSVPDLKFKFDIWVEKEGFTPKIVYSVEHYPTPSGKGILRPQEVLRSYIELNPSPKDLTGSTQGQAVVNFKVFVSEVSEYAIEQGIALDTDDEMISNAKAIYATQPYTKDYTPLSYLLKDINLGKKWQSELNYNYFDTDEYGTIGLTVNGANEVSLLNIRVTYKNGTTTTQTVDYSTAVGASGTYSYRFPAGPLNINSLIPGILANEWTKYELWITKNTINIMETYTVYYKAKKNCYDKKQYVFLNELGEWSYVTFTGKRVLNSENEHNEWSEYLSDSYSIGDKVRQNVHGNIRKGFSHHTGLLNETENQYVTSLMQSQTVYTIENGNLIPVIVTTKRHTELSRTNNNKLFQYLIGFEYGYNKSR